MMEFRVATKLYTQEFNVFYWLTMMLNFPSKYLDIYRQMGEPIYFVYYDSLCSDLVVKEWINPQMYWGHATKFCMRG